MRLTPDKHLHSREHLLADDLSRSLLEPKRFASYLGIAKMYDEADLRALAKRPRRFWKRTRSSRRRRRSRQRSSHA